MPAPKGILSWDVGLPPGAMQALQRTLTHAAHHTRYYSDTHWAARLRAGLEITVGDIPLTPKEAVRDDIAAFVSSAVPPADGAVTERYTSGSTGTPMRVQKTALHFAMNAAENDRLKAGWRFESFPTQLFATNSVHNRALGDVEEHSGPNGARYVTLHTGDSVAIGNLLRQMRPMVLSARASLAKGVLEDYPDIDFLRLVSTVGDTVAPDFAKLIARIPDCRHFDCYGSAETGVIAGTCAACGRYHMAFRHMWTEILNDDGHPTEPGKLGGVVVTPLYNLAMPLIRYDIGDDAVRSTAPACGDGGLSFDRVWGKRRNLFKLSDGSKVMPYLVRPELFDLGVKQYKLVQTTIRDVEFRYVPQQPGFAVDAAAVQRLVDVTISPLLQVACVAVDDLPIKPRGKFTIYESLV